MKGYLDRMMSDHMDRMMTPESPRKREVWVTIHVDLFGYYAGANVPREDLDVSDEELVRHIRRGEAETWIVETER